MLALAGGVLGLIFAAGALSLLVSFAARFTPRANEISIDVFVLLFTLVISLGTGLAFGLMPALSSDQNLTAALKEGGRTSTGAKRTRVRNALIVAQVAISFIVLIGAGLMLRSLIKLQHVDAGFSPESVLVMRVSPNWSKYTTPEQNRNLLTRLIEDVKHQPGLVSAALSNSYPLNPAAINNGPFYQSFRIENRDTREGELAPRADFRVVTPDYFDTVRMALVAGRFFTESDGANSPAVALINQSTARHRWGDEDPIGKRISFNNGQNWVTIIGIVGDVKHYGLDHEPADEIYRPLAQVGFAGFLLARTASDPLGMAEALRQTIHRIDPEIAVDRVQTLEQVRSESVSSPRLTAILLAMFAGLALVITAAGIAGVMALSVSQRTHELGIRMALGASQGRVLGMVIRQGMFMVGIGLALGIAGALLLSQVMGALLYSVEPTDPLTFFAVSFVLLAVAVLACFAPARRVTTIDPMIALRGD
jgi:putative ABC transport system permease protein